MSTKSTIVCGDKFHLYQECFDNKNIYLRFAENTSQGFDISIPLALWEYIRNFSHTILDTPYADKTNAEITEMVNAAMKDKSATDFYKTMFGTSKKDQRSRIRDAKKARDQVKKIRTDVKRLDKENDEW